MFHQFHHLPINAGIKIWTWSCRGLSSMRLPFRRTSKWSLWEDLHFHWLPYEGSVLIFELHSIKMVGRVGFEPTMFTSKGAWFTVTCVRPATQTYPWLKWRKWQDLNPHATSLRLLAVFKTAPLPIRVTLPYGGSNWIWTNDAHAFNVSLYQLSYRAIMVEPKGLAPLP